MRELRYALRRLRGSPMFTIGATLTLAITIGATASVFSLVDGVLLKAFPYRSPDRVLTIWESNPARQRPQASVATATFFDFQSQNGSFGSVAATAGPVPTTVTWPHKAEQVLTLVVTGDYFKVLGIAPILGRPLSPDTSVSEVVIGYGYWQRRFGGSRSVLGRTILLDNGNDQRPTPRHTYTIVGVMPPGLAGQVEMWTPIFFEPIEATDHDDRYLNVYARLKPSVTPEAAQRDLETIAARLAVSYPKTNAQWSVVTVPLLDVLVGAVRPALLTLLAAAGCVLLIGAATLANLFLVRCLARQREIAVRVALGAAHGRLVRELAVEAATLALGAGAIGVAVAVAGARALRTLAPTTLPRLSEIGVDARVVAFCALASITTAFVFGLLPAWAASSTNLAELLKEGGRGTGSAQRNRLQGGLVIAQVAVAVVLLTGAGLLVASFAHFERMDPVTVPLASSRRGSHSAPRDTRHLSRLPRSSPASRTDSRRSLASMGRLWRIHCLGAVPPTRPLSRLWGIRPSIRSTGRLRIEPPSERGTSARWGSHLNAGVRYAPPTTDVPSELP